MFATLGHLGFWDWSLIVAASVMGTAIAYLPKPEQKAFVVMLPVPFTLSILALNRKVDATNVMGMCLVFVYTITVWSLHRKLRLPIVLCIIIGATEYLAIGWVIGQYFPTTDLTFWLSAAATILFGVLLIRLLPPRPEPDSRTTLPLWLKFSTIAAVTTGILVFKNHFGGVVTMFPLVGVVAAYEARHSLWTVVRRIPWIMVMMTSMMITCYLTQDRYGLPIALVCGWVLMLSCLYWFYRGDRGLGNPRVSVPRSPDVS